MICRICNKEVKNEHALSIHVRLKHNIDYVQYNVKFNKFKIPKCPYCNKDRMKRKLNNNELVNIEKNNKKHSENNVNLKIDKIKNSNINFSRQGWVSEVSKILEISPQKVTQWMRKNMYEFWNENCFKRKGTKII